MTGGKRLLTVIIVAAAVFGAGVVVGAYGLGGAGQAPCWQVEQDLQAAKDVLAETFGSGPEGEVAIAQLQEKAEERPDCFSPATRDLLQRQREQLEQRDPQDAPPSEDATPIEPAIPTEPPTPSEAASDA